MLDILLDDVVDKYLDFATDYHEIELDRSAVEHIVALRPLTDAVIQTLNPERTLDDLHEDIAAIGYPTAVGRVGPRPGRTF